MKYRTFTFTGPASINLAKAWCEQYELDYDSIDSNYDSIGNRRGGHSVTVRWPDAEHLTIDQLLGRAKMLDRILDRDPGMWKMWR